MDVEGRLVMCITLGDEEIRIARESGNHTRDVGQHLCRPGTTECSRRGDTLASSDAM